MVPVCTSSHALRASSVFSTAGSKCALSLVIDRQLAEVEVQAGLVSPQVGVEQVLLQQLKLAPIYLVEVFSRHEHTPSLTVDGLPALDQPLADQVVAVRLGQVCVLGVVVRLDAVEAVEGVEHLALLERADHCDGVEEVGAATIDLLGVGALLEVLLEILAPPRARMASHSGTRHPMLRPRRARPSSSPAAR